MRVAAYVRVSTSRQVKLQTIEQQLERVRKHVREKGWEVPEENVFRDDGHSGTTLKRPALDALRDKVRILELEIIVMLSPDRLARNYVHQMVLIEEFEKNGCKVEFVERPMSSEPNDQLLLQIIRNPPKGFHSRGATTSEGHHRLYAAANYCALCGREHPDSVSEELWPSTRGRFSRKGCVGGGWPSTRPGYSCHGRTPHTVTESIRTGPVIRPG
jgi:hypothetical protein